MEAVFNAKAIIVVNLFPYCNTPPPAPSLSLSFSTHQSQTHTPTHRTRHTNIPIHPPPRPLYLTTGVVGEAAKQVDREGQRQRRQRGGHHTCGKCGGVHVVLVLGEWRGEGLVRVV
jgi:hypothetical protein